MSALRVEYQPLVCGGHLKAPVFMRNVRKLDGVTFFKLAKSDHCVAKMLVQEVKRGTRPLAMTDVIERLTALRDEAYASHLCQPLEDDKEDLGLDVPPRGRAVNRRDIPAVVTVQAPDIDVVPGIPLKVLNERKGKPLWIELTDDALSYLSQSVARQIETGEIKRVHPREHVSEDDRIQTHVKGVSYSYRRSSFRVVVKHADGARASHKYFKVNDAASLDEQKEEAISFLERASSSQDLDMGALRDLGGHEDLGGRREAQLDCLQDADAPTDDAGIAVEIPAIEQLGD